MNLLNDLSDLEGESFSSYDSNSYSNEEESVQDIDVLDEINKIQQKEKLNNPTEQSDNEMVIPTIFGPSSKGNIDDILEGKKMSDSSESFSYSDDDFNNNNKKKTSFTDDSKVNNDKPQNSKKDNNTNNLQSNDNNDKRDDSNFEDKKLGTSKNDEIESLPFYIINELMDKEIKGDSNNKLRKEEEEEEEEEEYEERYRPFLSIMVTTPVNDLQYSNEVLDSFPFYEEPKCDLQLGPVQMKMEVTKEIIDNLIGFVNCNNTGVFLVDSQMYVSVFFAHGLGNEFKGFDFITAPQKRKQCSVFKISDTKLGILGGHGISNGIDFWVFSHSPIPKWENVRVIGPNFPTLYNHKTVCIQENNKYFIYSFGGIKFNKFTNSLLLIIYFNGFCSYREFTPHGNTPLSRINHSFTVVGDKIYLFGGISDNNEVMNDLWLLDTSINGHLNPIWKLINCENPPSRHSHHSFSMDNELYIAGGFDENGFQLNDIWKFDGKEWILCGAFDNTKTVFSSSFGLIKFSSVFELAEKLKPCYAFSSKYEILKKNNKKNLKKAHFYSERILYEQNQLYKIDSITNQIKQGLPKASFQNEIKNLFENEKNLSKIQKQFIDEANVTFVKLNEFLNTKTSVEYHYSKFNKRLSQKINNLKLKYEWLSQEEEDNIQISKQNATKLIQKQNQRQPPEIDNSYTTPISEILKNYNLDINHQVLFTNYYFINQQFQYERNQLKINYLNERIQHYKEKLSKRNELLTTSFKQISQIKKDIEDIQNKSNEYENLYEKIKPQCEKIAVIKESKTNLDEKKYKETLEENKNLRNQIKEDIKAIQRNKTLFLSLQTLLKEIRNNYKKRIYDETFISDSKLKLEKMYRSIFETI